MIERIWTNDKWSILLSSIVGIEESVDKVKVNFEFHDDAYDFIVHLVEVMGLLNILEYGVFDSKLKGHSKAKIEYLNWTVKINGLELKKERDSDYIEDYWEQGPKLPKNRVRVIRDVLGELVVNDLDSVLEIFEKLHPVISDLTNVYKKAKLLPYLDTSTSHIRVWSREVPALERLISTKLNELITYFNSSVYFGSIYNEFNKVVATFTFLHLLSKNNELKQLDRLVCDEEFERFFQLSLENLSYIEQTNF